MSDKSDIRILSGRVGRDWENKQTKTGKSLWTTSIAVKTKDPDNPLWVRLTIWPDKQSGSDAFGRAAAGASKKGTPVFVRGPLKKESYVNKDGQEVETHEMSVWDLGIGVTVPRDSSEAALNAVQDAFPGAKVDYSEEPF